MTRGKPIGAPGISRIQGEELGVILLAEGGFLQRAEALGAKSRDRAVRYARWKPVRLTCIMDAPSSWD